MRFDYLWMHCSTFEELQTPGIGLLILFCCWILSDQKWVEIRLDLYVNTFEFDYWDRSRQQLVDSTLMTILTWVFLDRFFFYLVTIIWFSKFVKIMENHNLTSDRYGSLKWTITLHLLIWILKWRVSCLFWGYERSIESCFFSVFFFCVLKHSSLWNVGQISSLFSFVLQTFPVKLFKAL
jgi:hypothetical protein